MDLPGIERENIIRLCKEFGVKKTILFGSRATDKNSELSDIDIAIGGANDFDSLFVELKYNEFTLLDIDVVNLDDSLSDELLQEINRDGILIYDGGSNGTKNK